MLILNHLVIFCQARRFNDRQDEDLAFLSLVLRPRSRRMSVLCLRNVNKF